MRRIPLGISLGVFLGFGLVTNSVSASVFKHINTEKFKVAATKFYLEKVKDYPQRKKIIELAIEECGGRYEGIDVKAWEISHDIGSAKEKVKQEKPNSYSVLYNATSETKWLITEIIKCSVHSGHTQSTLHSRIIWGREAANILYHYTNDEQVGPEKVVMHKQSFSLGTWEIESEYKTPYGTLVPKDQN